MSYSSNYQLMATMNDKLVIEDNNLFSVVAAKKLPILRKWQKMPILRKWVTKPKEEIIQIKIVYLKKLI